MSKGCSINIIEQTVKANNGENSLLFETANKIMPFENAVDVWSVAQTPTFKSDVENVQLDKNGEPSLKTTVNYIYAKSAIELSAQEKTELRKSLINTTVRNSTELAQTLKEAFIPNPTVESLKLTGLYTQTEIENILNDPQTVQDIQKLIYNIENSEEVDNDITTNKMFQTTNGETNIIGKSEINNPFIEEQNAIQLLGGIKNEADFQSALQDEQVAYLPLSSFSFFRDFNNVPQKTLQNGTLTDKPNNDTQELLEATLKAPNSNRLQKALQDLEGISPFVWDNSKEAVETLLNNVQKQAVDIALDLPNLSDYTQIEIMPLVRQLQVLLADATQTNLDNFIEVYNNFYDVDVTPARQVINVQEKFRNKNLVYLETENSAYNVFAQTGLLKVNENVYIKTDALNKTLAQTYDSLYANSSVFPAGTFNASLSNRPLIQEDMEEYVSSQLAKINIDGNYDADIASKMVLYSTYFGTDLENPAKENNTTISKETAISNLGINVNEEDISNLRIEQIKEAHITYSNLRFDRNGVQLIYIDPISIAEMEDFLNTEDGTLLKNILLSQRFGNYSPQIEINDEIEDLQNQRDFLRNFPQSLEKYVGQYETVDADNIVVKGAEDFVRIGNDIYERQNSNVYTRLEPNNSNFKEYGYQSPQTNVNQAVFLEASGEVDLQIKSLINTGNRKEIENSLDKCN